MEVLLSNALSCFSQVPVIRSSSRTHQTTGFLLQIEKQRVVPRLHVGTQTRLRAQPMDMALSLASEPDRDPVVLLQVRWEIRISNSKKGNRKGEESNKKKMHAKNINVKLQIHGEILDYCSENLVSFLFFFCCDFAVLCFSLFIGSPIS